MAAPTAAAAALLTAAAILLMADLQHHQVEADITNFTDKASMMSGVNLTATDGTYIFIKNAEGHFSEDSFDQNATSHLDCALKCLSHTGCTRASVTENSAGVLTSCMFGTISGGTWVAKPSGVALQVTYQFY